MKHCLSATLLFILLSSCQSSKKGSSDDQSLGDQAYAGGTQESSASAAKNDASVKLCHAKATREKGIRTLLESIEKKESIELNFFRLGVCFLYAYDMKRAIFNFNRSLFNTKDVILKSANLHNIAYAQLRMGKYKRAIEYLKESSKLGMHPLTSYNLSALQLHLNLIKEQAASYQWLRRHADIKGDFNDLLADLALSLSYYEDAVKYYEKVSDDQFAKNTNLIVHYLIALFRTNHIEQMKKVLVEKHLLIEKSAYYKQMAGVYPEIGKFD